MGTYRETRIAELEARIVELEAARAACVSERTLYPGTDAWTLRVLAQREEDRRSGLRGIDQALDGARHELAALLGLAR